MAPVAGFFMGALGIGAAPAFGSALFGGWALGAAAGSSVIGSLAVRLLTSVALSALSRALAPDPGGRAAGIRTTATMTGGVNPDGFILGWYSTEGQLVAPPMSHGKSGRTPNYYLNYVIEVGGIPGQQLDGLIIDGEPVEIGETPHEDYGLPILGRFEDRAWVRYYDGSQTVADAMLVAKYPAPYMRPWGADRIGAGICYAVLTFAYDREVWSGFPKVRFVLHGIPLYDPRLDSTQPGGLGSHRWGQPATWQSSTNPVVQIYNILRGIALPGGDTWGGDVEAEDLPLSVWTAAMDRCDALVNTRPRYRAGFEVRVDDEPFAVIEQLLRSASADLCEIGGQWSIAVGEPDLPVMFVSDDDIIVTEPEDFEPFPAPDGVYNGIAASYPSPGAAWESKESAPIHFAEMEAEDGGRRLMADLQLPAVPWPGQVQRLARAYVKDNRRWRRHVLTLGFAAAMLEPHDTISWTSDRNYYSSKLFEVVEAVRDPQVGLVQVVLRERDPSDYDPAPEVLPDPPTMTPVLPAMQAVPGWTVSAVTLADAAGVPRRPAIQMGWDAGAIEDARGIRWQIRLVDRPADILGGSTQDIEAGGATVASGILPASAYQARARVIAQRPTEWSSWISVVTADLKLGPADLDWTDLETEILGQLADLEAWMNSELDLVDDTLADVQAEVATLTADQAQQAADLAAQAAALAGEAAARGDLALVTAQHYRDLARSMETLRDYVSELDYQSYSAREELRRQISVVVEGYAASFDERITVAASETGAIVERVTVLEAEGDSLSAQIIAVDTARVGGENALAQQIAAVSVGTNTQFDQAKIWYFDTAVEGWAGSPSAPTATGGYLRPSTGAGAWVASPAGLAVETEVYSQVRARLRRVGTPGWSGYLWWQATGEGWDVGRRVAVAEPTWVDGIADITVTPPWTGVLDQIRLDLASAPDGSNYIEIDWIAIGRPSPGASRAELITERTARISADEAQATAITTLEASLSDLEGETTATADAVQALDGRVTSAEGLLTAQATAITGLQSDVAGKASAAAVSELTTEVSELSDGLTSQSAAVIALRNSIDPLAAEGLDAQFAAFLADRDLREATASADEVIRTDVTAQGAEMTVLSEKVTLLEAMVPGLAGASALETLTARVTATETSITSQASAITALQSDVAGKASASALTALTTRVTDAENTLVSTASAVTTLQSDVASKASASAVNSLTTRVSDAEAALTSQSSAITTLQNDVAGKASTTALNALTTRVTAAEGTISSQSSAITNLQSDIAGKASASALSTLDTKVTTVETTANSKNRVFRASTAPSNPGIGDLWFDTDDNSKCWRWSGTGWVSVQDGNIPALQSTVTSHATAITNLQSDVAGKASTNALNALTTRVTTAEGNITANANALTALTADVGKFAASGKFRVSVEATPSGATSRIGLSATASGGATTQTAALFLEATSSGVGRVLVNADRFAIINGTARDVPFVLEGGTTYIKKVMIKSGDIDADKIDTDSFSTAGMALFGGTLKSDNYESGVSGWRITKAGAIEADSLTVRTGMLASRSVSNFRSDSAGNTPFSGNDWITVASISFIPDGSAQIPVWFSISIFGNSFGGGEGGLYATRYRLVWRGTQILYSFGSGVERTHTRVAVLSPGGTSSGTLSLQVAADDPGGSGVVNFADLVAGEMKR